jgi:nicotinamide-nucleotide amidase
MPVATKKILEKIGSALIAKKQTIAVAESVTSGCIQLALSNIPDAADFYQGGLTAYNIGQKYKHLEVEPVHAKAVNCVSQQVANQMALQICKQFGSDWGVSITGYATPVDESGNKIFAYYAIAFRGKIKLKGSIKPPKAKPEQVQLHYTDYIMRKLSALL